MPSRSVVYRSNETVVLAVMFCFDKRMLDGLQHIFQPSFLFLFDRVLAIASTRTLHRPINLQRMMKSLVGAETCYVKMTASCNLSAADLQILEAMHSFQRWSGTF